MKLRHKAELKALMAQPAKGFGGKKKQKEDAAALEAQHKLQLAELDKADKEAEEQGEDAQAAGGEAEDASAKPESAAAGASFSLMPTESAGPSRAQQKRAQKAAKEKARLQELREETKDMADLRGDENRAIAALLDKQQMAVREIVSDGHCLYRAVGDQALRKGLGEALAIGSLDRSHVSMRDLAAAYIDSNRDEFAAFMEWEDEAAAGSDGAWKQYLSQLRSEDAAVWGGQLEVAALSKALRKPIVIWSANGRMEIGEDLAADGNEPLHISFHQHYYGLGNHYNSVVPAEKEEEFQES